MTTEMVVVGNSLVARDLHNPWRWFDAFGPSVRKWEFGPNSVVSTTTAAGCTVTQTNGTLATADSTTGGAVVLTLGGADDDVIEVQSLSELFYFANRWPAYFGCKFRMVDADQQDISVGFTVRDADHAGGVADGIYFRVVDNSAVISLVLEKTSVETATAVATGANATDIQLELYYDGDYVYAYVNGALAASVAATNASFCNDEHLCATVTNQAGAAGANHLTLYWAKAIQVQST